jgi:hypothetical protein
MVIRQTAQGTPIGDGLCLPIFHSGEAKALYKKRKLWQILSLIEYWIGNMNYPIFRTIAISIIIRAHSPGG